MPLITEAGQTGFGDTARASSDTSEKEAMLGQLTHSEKATH